MAIVSLKPDVTGTLVPPPVTIPQALGQPNQSVFTSLYPESRITSLLKYVEGYPWTVNFYGQIINTANTLEHVDPTSPNFTQPVYEIKGAILQVSSALSPSYDESTGVTTVTGSAIVPYGVVPSQGDFFVAQVDTGEDAVFTISSVSRKTHRKGALYEIGYSLYIYTSTDPLFAENVQKRVQQTYYFNKDTNFFNRDLLISPQTKETTDQLKQLLRQSREYYFERFLKKESGLILIPGTVGRYYDQFLNRFILKTVPQDYFSQRWSSVSLFDRYVFQPTIFDAIMSRSLATLSNVEKTVSFANTASLPNKARFGSAFHAGIDFVAYPTVANTDDDIEALANHTPIDLFDRGFITTKNTNDYNPMVSTGNNDTGTARLLLHPLFENDYYVVSAQFYDYVDDKVPFSSVSLMEVLIYRFLNRDAIDRGDLLLVLGSYRKWSLLDQMYFLPVIWVMISSLGI